MPSAASSATSSSRQSPPLEIDQAAAAFLSLPNLNGALQYLQNNLPIWQKTTFGIAARVNWLEEHHPNALEEFRVARGDLSDIIPAAMQSARKQRNEVVSVTKAVREKSGWGDWDWRLPREKTPLFWTLALLRKMLTLATMTSARAEALNMVASGCKDRLKSGKGARDLRIVPNDIQRVIATLKQSTAAATAAAAPTTAAAAAAAAAPTTAAAAAAATTAEDALPEQPSADTGASIERGLADASLPRTASSPPLDFPSDLSRNSSPEAVSMARKSARNNGKQPDYKGMTAPAPAPAPPAPKKRKRRSPVEEGDDNTTTTITPQDDPPLGLTAAILAIAEQPVLRARAALLAARVEERAAYEEQLKEQQEYLESLREHLAKAPQNWRTE